MAFRYLHLFYEKKLINKTMQVSTGLSVLGFVQLIWILTLGSRPSEEVKKKISCFENLIQMTLTDKRTYLNLHTTFELKFIKLNKIRRNFPAEKYIFIKTIWVPNRSRDDRNVKKESTDQTQHCIFACQYRCDYYTYKSISKKLHRNYLIEMAMFYSGSQG